MTPDEFDIILLFAICVNLCNSTNVIISRALWF